MTLDGSETTPGTDRRDHPAGSLPGPPTARLPYWLALADESGGALLEKLLPGSGLVVETDTKSFVEALRAGEPQLVILVAPPSGPAEMRLVAHERESRPGFGAVLLSGHESIAPRLHALQLGFDDAVDLSADRMEISSRLSTAGRARDRQVRVPPIWVGPDVQLDVWARTLWRSGRPRRLRPRDFELLRFLIEHSGQAFSRRELLDAWPGNTASTRMIDVTIWRLRALIESVPAAPEQFVTVPRVGYRYDPPARRR